MIVRVQSAELSSVQRFVLRLIGDWGTGSERVGGIALLGCPLPRPRRRAAMTADLLIWTPRGCTLVLLADFGSVQHGVLDTPSAGRWCVGERAADLRTGSGAVNPLQRARRQRAELAAIFRRAGVPEQIDVLVVLIPKTGSRITWTRPPQESGEETIMVRIGQSTGFAGYFQRPPARPVHWSAAETAEAFSALGVPLSAPDPAEAADEGFVVTPADTMIGAPTRDLPASPLRKAGLPLFGGSRRRAAQPDIVFPGPVVAGAAERAEYPDAVPGSGAAGIAEERSSEDTAARRAADREATSGCAEALPDASGGRPRMDSAPRHGYSDVSVSEFDTTGFAGAETNADVERSGPAVPGHAVGATVHGDDVPEKPRTGVGTTRARVLAGDPVEQPDAGAPGRGRRRSAQDAVGIRRGITGMRQARARRRDRGTVAQSAGAPRRPDHEQPADPRASGRRGRDAVTGRSREKAGDGRGARYAAALGATGAVLAVAAGTVFAASGAARFEVAEYGALCQGSGGTTVAAPYAAAGPSPVYLAGELPEISAFGPSAVWHPVDARSVQLVACVSEGRLGELVRTCQYPPAPGQPVGRTLNLFAMAYRLSVYEARTGNRLAAIDLTGEQFAADPAVTEPDGCRAAGEAPEEGLPGRRHSRLSHQQIQRALAPFVTPAAPHIQAAR